MKAPATRTACLSLDRLPKVLSILLANALSLALSGCAVYTASEVDRMQQDIGEIKLELGRLRQSIEDSDTRMLYSLGMLEEKIDYREPFADGAPGDVAGQAIGLPGDFSVASGQEAGVEALPQVAAARSEADQFFRQALQLWVDEDIAGAQRQFVMFLERFPSHPRASEAQFWIGDCLYKSGRYGDAIAAYQRVIRNWPGSSMEPEAAAKIGYSYYNLQDFRTAAQALQIVVDRYPYYGQIERVREHLAVLQRAVGAR